MLEDTFRRVKSASKQVANIDDALRNRLLCLVADAIETETDTLLQANRQDLAKMDKNLYRMIFTSQRNSMAIVALLNL